MVGRTYSPSTWEVEVLGLAGQLIYPNWQPPGQGQTLSPKGGQTVQGMTLEFVLWSMLICGVHLHKFTNKGVLTPHGNKFKKCWW